MQNEECNGYNFHSPSLTCELVTYNMNKVLASGESALGWTVWLPGVQHFTYYIQMFIGIGWASYIIMVMMNSGFYSMNYSLKSLILDPINLFN